MATSTQAIKKLQTVNAVVYARYSSHSQGEQSIDGQLSAAKKYAEAKGYTIVHEYIDRAMTGRNDNREGVPADALRLFKRLVPVYYRLEG